MSSSAQDLIAAADALRNQGLLDSSFANLRSWIGSGALPEWATASLGELISKSAVAELNDRFYRPLEFGTGGMRGRTIGRIVTAAEQGQPGPQGTPEHAGVGCNMLNDFTVVQATIGLYRYAATHVSKSGRSEPPRLVIAHDVRHFSRHFCELACSVWTRLGGIAWMFDGPRSTPQLSFSVRWLKATCGVVITASHNPPHDNGFKAYFEDGGQVVAPHDAAIIAEVGKVGLADVTAHLSKCVSKVLMLGAEADAAYSSALLGSVIDRSVFKKVKLKAVFSAIHGTGRISTIPALKSLGVSVSEVPGQDVSDPRFPTVKSPNPENAEALSMAVALAKKSRADIVMATDPDCDRMGVAIRTADGEMKLLTGNQVGAMLAEYRISKFKKLGWIPAKGTKRAALIKTFVTSRLQDAIGEAHGLKVINTLTGFKWIAAKIRGYEEQLSAALMEKEGLAIDYDRTSFETRARLLQKYSTFYVFGDEESYGYLPNDSVRDKDGNAACLMFAEMAAEAKSKGMTLDQYLDGIFLKYGFYTEAVGQIYYEGAAGAAKIRRILESYRSKPPKSFDGIKVTKFEDFGRQKILDADGERIPKQDLYFVHLANGFSYGVRGSGTEPKIKFYLFGTAKVSSKKALASVKSATQAALEQLRKSVEADAHARSS
jgi:phosphoglucomutase